MKENYMKIKKVRFYGLMVALVLALGVMLFSGCVQPKIVSPSGEPLMDAVVFILPQGEDLDLPPTVLFMAMENPTVPRAYLDEGGSYKVIAWAPGCDGARRIVTGENLSKEFGTEIALNELVGGPAAELSGILMLKEVFGEFSTYPSDTIWSNGRFSATEKTFI